MNIRIHLTKIFTSSVNRLKRLVCATADKMTHCVRYLICILSTVDFKIIYARYALQNTPTPKRWRSSFFFFGSFAMKYLSHSSTVPGIETTKTFDKVSG